MTFSRHLLIYHIIFRFSHYPVVSTPLVAIYYILFTSSARFLSLPRSFVRFAFLPVFRLFRGNSFSFLPSRSRRGRGTKRTEGRQKGRDGRDRCQGALQVSTRYRCCQDSCYRYSRGVKTVSSPARRGPSLNHPSYCEGRHCQEHPSTRLPLQIPPAGNSRPNVSGDCRASERLRGTFNTPTRRGKLN